MKLFGMTLAIVCLMTAPSPARDARFDSRLRRLDPATRLEQICSLETMARISRDARQYHPDRAVIDAVSAPKISGNSVQGSGGAFRSRGRWYQFEFTCKTTDDHMKVLTFDYRIGAPIPEAQWSEYGLWRRSKEKTTRHWGVRVLGSARKASMAGTSPRPRRC
jgi:hypothetical protein